jgi:hypothetical protein
MYGRFVATAVRISILAGCSPIPSATPAAPARSPSGSPSTPVASPSADQSLAPTGWTDVFSSELAILSDVVAGPSGFIAVGCRADDNGDCLSGLLLTSPEGTSWTQIDLEGAAYASIRRVRRIGDRLFAIGFAIDDPRIEVRAVAWTSVDGRSWSRIRSASFTNRALADVINAPVGVIAIGGNARYASEGGGFVVWNVQPDGSFGKPRDVHPTGGPPAVQGAVWARDQYLAWGPCGPCPPGDEVTSTVLMASQNSQVWTVLPEIPAFHASTVMEIVAVGYEGDAWPTSPRAWTSSDGATWKAAEVAHDAASMYTVSVNEPLLVARGEDTSGAESFPESWNSTDGAVWTRLPDGEDMPAVPGFKALSRATLGDRACVVGTFYDDPHQPSPRAAIYCR